MPVETDPTKVAARVELTRENRRKHRFTSRQEAVEQIQRHARERRSPKPP